MSIPTRIHGFPSIKREMRITEVFGPGECWHSARDRLLVIRARCPEFDAHSTLSLCQTKRTSSPFFSTTPSHPPLLLVVSCLPLHFPVPLPPPRYDHAPLSSLITSSLHPHNETWHAHVDGRFAHSLFSSFSLPSVGGVVLAGGEA